MCKVDWGSSRGAAETGKESAKPMVAGRIRKRKAAVVATPGSKPNESKHEDIGSAEASTQESNGDSDPEARRVLWSVKKSKGSGKGVGKGKKKMDKAAK